MLIDLFFFLIKTKKTFKLEMNSNFKLREKIKSFLRFGTLFENLGDF